MLPNETSTAIVKAQSFRTVALVLCDNDYQNVLQALLETLKRGMEWHSNKMTRDQARLMVLEGLFSHVVVWSRIEGRTIEEITQETNRITGYLKKLKILFDQEAEEAILTCDHETGSWYYEVQSGVVAPFCAAARSAAAKDTQSQKDTHSRATTVDIFSISKLKEEHSGKIPSHSWPGGYPVYYVTADGGILSPKAVIENEELCSGDDPQWRVVAVQVNYEDTELYCDHTGERIDAAYE